MEIYDNSYLPNQPTVQNDPMAHYPPSPPWQQGVSNFLGNLSPQDAIAALVELLSRQSSPVDQQNPRGRRNFRENTEAITPSSNPRMDAVRNNWENGDPSVVLTAGSAQPNTAIHDINKLADLSVLKGAEIADTNTEESPWMIDTPLGQLDLKGFVQNFLRQSRNALAMPVHAGDWGLEPLARAQVMEESAAAASAQETAAEYIKQGINPNTGVPFNPDPPITESWQLKLMESASGGKIALDALQKMKQTIIKANPGDIWADIARALKETGEFLGIQLTGLDTRQITKVWRAQVIMTLAQSGMFGKEMSALDYQTLEGAMGPIPTTTVSAKELEGYIIRMEEFVRNKLQGISNNARNAGLQKPFEDILNSGMTFSAGPGGNISNDVKAMLKDSVTSTEQQ